MNELGRLFIFAPRHFTGGALGLKLELNLVPPHNAEFLHSAAQCTRPLITQSGGIGAKFLTLQNFDPVSRKARTN